MDWHDLTMYRQKLCCCWVLAIAVILTSCRHPELPLGQQGLINTNLLMGNPSLATPDPNNSDNYLIVRPQYALSYAKKKGIPNWVSWELSTKWIGDTPRSENFSPDEELPSDWYRVKPSDYRGSGFDRGHLVNSKDRSRSPEDNLSTFLMTNIMPQSPDNNRGVWEQLESYCRQLAQSGKQLFIIAGAAGQGGIGEKGLRATIANGKVLVPAVTWKVILVLDRPGSGITGVTKNTRTIAVVIPNKQGLKDDPWQKYITSVRQVEKLTGYNFFNQIPADIQTAIESKSDRS
jgi:endonuclease G